MDNIIVDTYASLSGAKPGRSYSISVKNRSVVLPGDVKLVVHGTRRLTNGVDNSIYQYEEYGTRDLLFGAFIADGDAYLGFAGSNSADSSVVKLKSRYMFILPTGYITAYSATVAGRYAASQVQITDIKGTCDVGGADLDVEYILAFSGVE